MEGTKVISVILPVYKVEKYLDQCVESLVNQTYSNLEIILVDDGSPDNCGKMCDAWAKRDTRIKVIHQDNEGISGARNAGLAIATGEFIGFADPDDYVHRHMYELLYHAISESNADVAACHELAFSEEVTEQEYERCTMAAVEDKEAFCNHFTDDFTGLIGWVWNKLYRRELIGDVKFKPGNILEDLIFNAEIAIKVKKAVWIEERLYYYRQHSTSTMAGPTCKVLQAYADTMRIERQIFSATESTAFAARHSYYCLNKLDELSFTAKQKGEKETATIIRKHFIEQYNMDKKRVRGAVPRIKLFVERYFPMARQLKIQSN